MIAQEKPTPEERAELKALRNKAKILESLIEIIFAPPGESLLAAMKEVISNKSKFLSVADEHQEAIACLPAASRELFQERFQEILDSDGDPGGGAGQGRDAA